MKNKFKLKSDFSPGGDQPKAIDLIVKRFKSRKHNQVLRGVTGSGKTFTMANVIAILNKPTLIMTHNKILAAQLYEEFKEFFPENAVEYFISYYDYYQPEAYMPNSGVFIEKDAIINERIDMLRHSATKSLLERKDVIVVASVSCIYGIGAPETYLAMSSVFKKDDARSRQDILSQLSSMQYKRTNNELNRGNFRLRGNIVEIYPASSEDMAYRISLSDKTIESIVAINPVSGKEYYELSSLSVFANSHYVTPLPTLHQAAIKIEKEFITREKELIKSNKIIEAQRLRERISYDLEMIKETGSCKGIENYSRYLCNSKPGDPPPTLFKYLPKDALLFVDESHVAIPQIRAMRAGDSARKKNLIEYGFRLPSAADNRPLDFEEWNHMRPRTLFVSATPGKFELDISSEENIAEQIARPTGLLDPVCEVRPASSQVIDITKECLKEIKSGGRVIVSTLTKKFSEHLSEHLKDNKIKAVFMHSEIEILERVKIVSSLREGEYDVLVGVNLLREGLDIPECSLVIISDADKEGFLRSETSIIQTIGRAARNERGRAILYADKITDSIRDALNETSRRRNIQNNKNIESGIEPKSISKPKRSILKKEIEQLSDQQININQEKLDPKSIKKAMYKAAAEMKYEEAARLRDQLKKIKKAR